MGKYDVLKGQEAAERAAGMAGYAQKQGLYKIVAGRPLLPSGSTEDYILPGIEEAKTEDVKLGGLKLEAAQLTASQTKQIVKTAINGQTGTVKEWVSDGDVAVNMTVTLLSQDNEYPYEKVERLKNVLAKNETLEVESRWLNEVWGVTRAVVENVRMMGHTEYNYEVVEIALASDQEYVVEEEMKK